MPRVSVRASVPGCDPRRLFEHVARFEAYPEIAENVIAVTVEGDGDALVSSWEVTFRKGILRWQEADTIDRASGRIGFAQTQGDLALFEGEWQVDDGPGGAVVSFEAQFDLGIPSLASMLDPAAGRTLAANARELIAAFARAGGGEACFQADVLDVAAARAL